MRRVYEEIVSTLTIFRFLDF